MIVTVSAIAYFVYLFCEPMSAFKNITDVSLTGGSPRYNLGELRAFNWGITAPKEQTVLLTFGGLGLQQIPYDNLKHFPAWQFITLIAPFQIYLTYQNY